MQNNLLMKIAIHLGLLFLCLLIGQLLGSYFFIKSNHLNTVNPGLSTLVSLYNETNGSIMSLFSYKLAIGIASFPTFLLIFIWLLLLLKHNKRELHGSAKFATTTIVTKAGLFKNEEKDPTILIGKFNNRYLQFAGKQFVFLAAPTRSGKGVGIVIPNCLHYSGSLVVMDIKLENFQRTAGYRQASGQEVYLLNLSTKEDLASHGWNPLSYISRNPIFATAQAQRISSIIYSASGNSSGTDRFFNEMAQKLFTGLCLYMVETEAETNTETTITNLVKLTTPDNMSLKDWIYNVCDSVSGIGLSDSCKSNLLSYAQNDDKTGSGILATLLAPLSVFTDPIVSEITSKDDFDLRDVRKKKMTIYIGISPDDLARFERILNLFFSQLINENINKLPEQTEHLPANHPDKLRYQCLLLLDEFAAIGKLEVMEKGVAFIAGYNIRVLAIYQNMAQLNRLYTKDGSTSISSNFECQIIYPTRINEDAKEYSDMIGYETFKAKSISSNTGRFISNSNTVSDQRRALLLPQEVMTMPLTDCIVRLTGIPAIYAQKIVYWQDDIFTPRLMPFTTVHIPKLELSQFKHKEILTKEERALIRNISKGQEILISSFFAMLNLEKDTDNQLLDIYNAIRKEYGDLAANYFYCLLKIKGRFISVNTY